MCLFLFFFLSFFQSCVWQIQGTRLFFSQGPLLSLATYNQRNPKTCRNGQFILKSGQCFVLCGCTLTIFWLVCFILDERPCPIIFHFIPTAHFSSARCCFCYWFEGQPPPLWLPVLWIFGTHPSIWGCSNLYLSMDDKIGEGKKRPCLKLHSSSQDINHYGLQVPPNFSWLKTRIMLLLGFFFL